MGYDYRTDGLLRGSRSERCREMRELGGAEWNLLTLLHLHTGTLDHADEAGDAVAYATLKIAARSPEPFTVSPWDFLDRLMGGWLSNPERDGYGARVRRWQMVLEMRTPEADEFALRTFGDVGPRGVEDIEKFARLALETGRRDLLEKLSKCELSKEPARALRRVMTEAEE